MERVRGDWDWCEVEAMKVIVVIAVSVTVRDGAILGTGGAVAPPRFSKKNFSIYI